MALWDIRFTAQQRKHLHNSLLAVILGQSAIGLILFLLGISVSISIGTNLRPVDRVVFDWVFKILAMYGFYVLLHNIVGVKLCYNYFHHAERPGTSLRIFIWTLVGLIMVLLGCFLASICVFTADHLVSQIRQTLSQGMMQYLTDPAWKRALDRMQIQMECCGIESHSDWHRTYWMHHDVLDEDSPVILEYAELDGRILPPVVPWSCCRIDAKGPCYHDPLQLPNPEGDLANESLNTQGCLITMKGPVVVALFSTIALVVLLFIVQLIIITLSRLDFTSARNAVALGSRYGPSPGWLYGRLDFGNATGPNLCQIDRKLSGRGDVMVDLKPLVYISDTE